MPSQIDKSDHLLEKKALVFILLICLYPIYFFNFLEKKHLNHVDHLNCIYNGF